MNKRIENGQETNAAELTTTANEKKTYCLPFTIKFTFEQDVCAFVEAESEEEARELFQSEEFEDFLGTEHSSLVWHDYDYAINYDIDYNDTYETKDDDSYFDKYGETYDGKIWSKVW